MFDQETAHIVSPRPFPRAALFTEPRPGPAILPAALRIPAGLGRRGMRRRNIMSLALAIVGWTFFALGIIAGLALDLVGLFGNWVILGTAAAAWLFSGFAHFGVWTLVSMTALALLGEVLEIIAAGYGAKKFGGGKGAMLASLVGCIVGAIVGTPWFPIVGTLIGAIAGAFGGAALYELLIVKKTTGASIKTGIGAALGRIGGVIAKLVIGLAMLLVLAFNY